MSNEVTPLDRAIQIERLAMRVQTVSRVLADLHRRTVDGGMGGPPSEHHRRGVTRNMRVTYYRLCVAVCAYLSEVDND